MALHISATVQMKKLMSKKREQNKKSSLIPTTESVEI